MRKNKIDKNIGLASEILYDYKVKYQVIITLLAISILTNILLIIN